MEVTGKLVKKYDATTHGDSFKRIEFIIETEDKYPQLVKMQATQERVPVVEKIEIGSTVKFNFNLKGREWTNAQGENVYFTNLEVWKLEVTDEPADEPKEYVAEDIPLDADGDELPF